MPAPPALAAGRTRPVRAGGLRPDRLPHHRHPRCRRALGSPSQTVSHAAISKGLDLIASQLPGPGPRARPPAAGQHRADRIDQYLAGAVSLLDSLGDQRQQRRPARLVDGGQQRFGVSVRGCVQPVTRPSIHSTALSASPDAVSSSKPLSHVRCSRLQITRCNCPASGLPCSAAGRAAKAARAIGASSARRRMRSGVTGRSRVLW
jgi:hypothetical protein